MKIIIVLFLLTGSLCGQNCDSSSQTGSISGLVLTYGDQKADKAIVRILNDSKFGTLTDENGIFTISNIPIGIYSIRCQKIGHQTSDVTDVFVKPDTISIVSFYLANSGQAISSPRSWDPKYIQKK